VECLGEWLVLEYDGRLWIVEPGRVRDYLGQLPTGDVIVRSEGPVHVSIDDASTSQAADEGVEW
jgi:hypothetical protein